MINITPKTIYRLMVKVKEYAAKCPQVQCITVTSFTPNLVYVYIVKPFIFMETETVIKRKHL